MSPGQLRRLRLRLTASLAVASLIGFVVLAVLVARADGDRKRAALDRRVEATALAADGYAYPQGTPSRLVVDREPDGYFGPRRRAGAPVVVVDPKVRVVAGDRAAIDRRAAGHALDRARRDSNVRVYSDTAAGHRARVAASPIYGDDGFLAAIVAIEPVAAVDADIRDTTLRIAGITLVLWLLTAAICWFLTGRALAPVVVVARREEAFLADAAHELRTPVAVIRARAEQALHDGDPASPTGEALRAIAQAAERASGTIADMLELARLDARRGRIEHEPLRLDLLLEQVVEEYHDRAAAAGADLRLRAAAEAVVTGDERLLARAVANLVENAIRYGAVGGEIEVSLEVDGAMAVVGVADRGPGVPPAQRAAVFDRFHRASSAAGGSGLGLPIARIVAEAHDGSLELLPEVDGEPGARFALRLPVAKPGEAG